MENAGLFGVISAPGKLVGITGDNAVVTGKAQVGVIAGSVFTGAAEDCHVTGAVNVTGNYKVGAMFGDGYANLSGCTVNVTGFVTGIYLARDLEGDCVGGLIGFRVYRQSDDRLLCLGCEPCMQRALQLRQGVCEKPALRGRPDRHIPQEQL